MVEVPSIETDVGSAVRLWIIGAHFFIFYFFSKFIYLLLNSFYAAKIKLGIGEKKEREMKVIIIKAVRLL
jgi:hypothetical protein